FENVVHGTSYDLSTRDVAVRADGGSLALATTESPRGLLVNWLVRLGRGGRPLWSEELGCLDLPPGDYTIGVSMAQTADGGFVLAGGTIGCGSSSFVQPALVQKLDAKAQVACAQHY